MKKVTFHMSDEDWESVLDNVGDGKKYISITDFMNDSARLNLARRKRETKTKEVAA